MVFRKALEMRLGGGRYLLDGYNNQVLTGDVSFTITTRIFGGNNHFLMEVYEDGQNDMREQQGGREAAEP